MFLLLLVLSVVAAGVHLARSKERTRARAGTLVVRYVLVGYCGVPMLVVAVAMLLMPDRTAETFGFEASGAVAMFLGWAYLGMAMIGSLAIRYRREFLIAPAVCWSVFFLGATGIHLHEPGGPSSHGGVLWIVATHGLVSVALIGGLIASGLLRSRSG